MRNWMETNVPRRLLAMALCLCMVLSLLPVFAFAEETDGLCQHHPAHTPECGYVAAVEGQDCTHVHDETCGYAEASDCGHQHDDTCGYQEASDCGHVHDESCGYRESSPCLHAHDETCGYVEAVAGQPCGFVCEACGTEESKPIPPEEKAITDWEWVDEWEIIDPDSGNAVLPFASAENVAQFDDIVALLPVSIVAEGEELTLGQWVCPDYPVETGAYEGAYLFQTNLPEGFALSDGSNVLRLTVVLGDPEGAPAAVLAITPAEPPKGTHTINGTERSGVYELSTPGHLYWFANQVNSGNTAINAIVMNDITVNSGVLNGDGSLNTSGSFESWTCIGDGNHRYSGTFDGNGKTISGLYVNNESTNYIGLFGYLDSGGTVVNVKIVDSYFAGKNYMGGICGWNGQGTVSNCYNSGTVTSSGEYVGGVCGYNYNGEVSNCYNSETVTGHINVGGVCGFNSGTVSNCYSSDTVTGSYTVGGVCGYNYKGNYKGEVSNCYNSGTVTGSDPVGGVCGRNSGTVSHCYFDNAAYTGSAIGRKGGTVTDVCGKSPMEFASGEVAYLLNGSRSEGTQENPLVWYQNIDKTGVTRDPYPKFTGATVYKTSDASPCQGYSNYEDCVREHSLQNYACVYCDYWESAPLTVSGITAQNKTYDGNTTAELVFDLTGVLSAYPNVTVTATGTFADANVGQDKPVAISGLTLTGADASRYNLADSGQQTSATASITAKPVTATVTVTPKTYDGTTAATVSAQVTEGVVSGDSITITGLTGSFENANAGTNKTVTVNTDNKSITGTGASNYAVTIPDTATGTITKAQAVITVEAGKTTYSKTYGDDPFQLTGITENSDDADGVKYAVTVGTDVVSVSTDGTVTILKARDATITLSLPESTNYLAAESVNITVHVAQKDSTVSITRNPGKTYDGQPAVLTADMFTATGDGTVTVEYKVQGAADTTYSSDAPTNAGDYTVRVTQAAGLNFTEATDTLNFTIAKKNVTITGVTVEGTKVYDGTTDARITATGTLTNTVPGDDVTLNTANAAAAYNNKNVDESKTVTFSGFALDGNDKDNYTLTQPANTTANITAKEVILTVTVKDKDFDDTTTAEIDTVTPNGIVSGDDVVVVNGTPSFKNANVGEAIPVSFTEFTLTGADAGNYQLTQPTGVTGRILAARNYLDLAGNSGFDGQTEVWVDGVRCPIETEDGRYVNLPEEGDLLTTFTYGSGSSALSHESYPTGMTVYRINRQASGATLEKIDAFNDLLQYSGCSIRVTGKRGIRMITSLTKGNKSVLTGSGLAGYTLEEYGTVVQWADTLGAQSLTLATGKSNYAYKKGVADPVFATKGDLTQYTNVLVWDSLTDAQLGQDIVMRPYIILRDGSGNTVTLYGGCVSRSIGYIAYQNRAVFNPGTAAYKYVWDIIHAVYGTQYDSEYQG